MGHHAPQRSCRTAPMWPRCACSRPLLICAWCHVLSLLPSLPSRVPGICRNQQPVSKTDVLTRVKAVGCGVALTRVLLSATGRQPGARHDHPGGAAVLCLSHPASLNIQVSTYQIPDAGTHKPVMCGRVRHLLYVPIVPCSENPFSECCKSFAGDPHTIHESLRMPALPLPAGLTAMSALTWC